MDFCGWEVPGGFDMWVLCGSASKGWAGADMQLDKLHILHTPLSISPPHTSNPHPHPLTS